MNIDPAGKSRFRATFHVIVVFLLCLILPLKPAFAKSETKAKTDTQTKAEAKSGAAAKTTDTTDKSATKKTSAKATTKATTKTTSKTTSKTSAAQKAPVEKAGKWIKKNEYYYYRSAAGKNLKGFQKINGEYYLFDQKGRQQTGWRKVDGKCRFFEIRNGKKGCMVKSASVNGFKIGKSGVAKVKTSMKRKMDVMLRFQKLADTLVKPAMKRKKKLVTVFKYARDKRYRSIGSPPATGDWDAKHAELFLNANYADCVIAACGFGYLANAVGYKDVSLRLYGHAHCEIGKLIYDPGFAKTVSDSNYTAYFGKTYQQLSAWRTGASTPRKVI